MLGEGGPQLVGVNIPEFDGVPGTRDPLQHLGRGGAFGDNVGRDGMIAGPAGVGVFVGDARPAVNAAL